MGAAYHVCRLPTLSDGEISWEYEPVKVEESGSFECSEEGEMACGHEIKLEDVREENIKEDPFFCSFQFSRDLGKEQEEGLPQHGHEHGVERLSFTSVRPEAIEGRNQLIFYGQNRGHQEVFNAHDQTLAINDRYREWFMEEWAMAHFDYDLACTRVFAAQLEEYQELMTRMPSGSERVDVKSYALGSGEMRDRLPLWPEKVTESVDMSEKTMKDVEENHDIEMPVVIEGALGEAGELMDWWHLQGHGC